MYHTKSTCLVNGKQTVQFCDNDFPEMLKLAEDRLHTQHVSVEDVNVAIQTLLMASSNKNNAHNYEKTVYRKDSP